MTNTEISELLNLSKALDATLDRLQKNLAKFEDLSLHFLALQAENKGLRVELEALRSQLAALQIEDELPELPEEFEVFTEDCSNGVIHGYTAEDLQAYARQAQAKARAKMMPLEKDAARYRWLTNDPADAEMRDRAEAVGVRLRWIGKGAADAAIDAAMGITGEPK